MAFVCAKNQQNIDVGTGGQQGPAPAPQMHCASPHAPSKPVNTKFSTHTHPQHPCPAPPPPRIIEIRLMAMYLLIAFKTKTKNCIRLFIIGDVSIFMILHRVGALSCNCCGQASISKIHEAVAWSRRLFFSAIGVIAHRRKTVVMVQRNKLSGDRYRSGLRIQSQR